MSKFEEDYKELIRSILLKGTIDNNRTGVNTLVMFNRSIDFNMSHNYMPVITGKQIYYDKAYHEFMWMWNGGTTTHYLNEHGINWWNEYADDNGYLGKTYGYQLRNFNGHKDQITWVIKQIQLGTRRTHITFWNPSELEETALPPCYTGMTFVRIHDKLNVIMQLRSSDVFLGLPYDFIIGALFLKKISEKTFTKPGTISYSLANAHIYLNHKEQCYKYLRRPTHQLPFYNSSDKLDYQSESLIKAKLNN